MEARGDVDRIGAPSLDWMGVPLKRGNVTYGALALQTYEEKHPLRRKRKRDPGVRFATDRQRD